MLDRRFILDNIDLVKKNCLERGVKADLDRFVALESERRQSQQEVERLNQQANEKSKSIGKAPPAERDALKEEGRKLREQIGEVQKRLEAIGADLDVVHGQIPNLTHPDAPRGGEHDARIVRTSDVPKPAFSFKPRDHVEIAESLGLLDLDGGARVAGHGFYFLKNEAVLLELALQQFAVETLIGEGFTPTITPDLARQEILEGIGFNPRGAERQIYNIADTDLSLVATAEITLGGLYADQIFEADQLPLKICGVSHCFRTEAGAHGRATRGIYRVHQFTKVEMFAFTLPEQSDAMHEDILRIECKFFDSLGLHYHVIDTASGDLGGPAYRKYDLEAWMPGRGEGGEYGEVTSTSNCTDYQARRLRTRFRIKGEKGTQFVHTLNGTAVAVTRALVAILENYQQADGSVVVPEVLRKWVGKDRIGPKQ